MAKKIRVEVRFSTPEYGEVETERVIEAEGTCAAAIIELMGLPSGIDRLRIDARVVRPSDGE